MDEYVHLYNIGKSDAEADLPYWYSEYANVGFLTGAVWRLGGVVLSEGTYRSRSSANDKIEYPKRCDCRFLISDLSDVLDCNLEAKQAWPQKVDETVFEVAQKFLYQAKKQLDQLRPIYRGDTGIAICFISPSFKNRSAASDFDQLIDVIAGRFRDQDGILASYRPPIGASTFDETESKRYYPGVILIGQRVIWSDASAEVTKKADAN